jgi:hypothetical protein
MMMIYELSLGNPKFSPESIRMDCNPIPDIRMVYNNPFSRNNDDDL